MAVKLLKPSCTEDLLLSRISRLLAVSGGAVIRLCEGQFGITWREWRLIASLRPGVSMVSSELAQNAQLDRSRTSKTISSLEQKGLLTRQGVTGDLRKTSVCLTQSGQDLYERFFPVVASLNARLLRALSQQELAVLDKALRVAQKEADEMQTEGALPKTDRRRGGRPIGPANGFTP